MKKMKKIRRKSLAAASTLMNSVRSKDLKMLKKCKRDPKKMFDVICAKYGNKEDSDLTLLLATTKCCTMVQYGACCTDPCRMQYFCTA